MTLRVTGHRWIKRTMAATLLFAAVISAGSCHRKQGNTTAAASASASASAAPVKLSAEQAAQVLARVGDRTITLGDYAASLERMDTFERLRYQSPDRRRLLLNEMIELELLSQEAKRRGLDQQPDTQERLRQILRDEYLREERRKVETPNEIPNAEVRKYYDEHKADFNEPERRRVSHIAVASLGQAKALLKQAESATAAEWGKLVGDNSLDKGTKGLGAPPSELAGDLGIVGPPDHPRGSNPRVPEALRAAAFKIEKVPGVYGEPVTDGGKFHIVRVSSRTEPRERTFEEAERTIRITLVQERVKQREADLQKDLRSKFPVTIDNEALAQIPPPKPAPSGSAGSARPLRP